eukprot:190663-Amphidinium_carterae.1
MEEVERLNYIAHERQKFQNAKKGHAQHIIEVIDEGFARRSRFYTENTLLHQHAGRISTASVS